MPELRGVDPHVGPRVMVRHHRNRRTYFILLKPSIERKLPEQGDEVPGLGRYGDTRMRRQHQAQQRGARPAGADDEERSHARHASSDAPAFPVEFEQAARQVGAKHRLQGAKPPLRISPANGKLSHSARSMRTRALSSACFAASFSAFLTRSLRNSERRPESTNRWRKLSERSRPTKALCHSRV